MHLESDVELAPRTSLRVGGRARLFASVASEAELERALAIAEQRALRVFVLGGGSNVVVPDAGLDGLVLAIELRGIEIERTEARAIVAAAAGEPWDALVADSVERGFQGLECLSGIPGLVGATPIQNVGAYGQEVADSIVSVRAFDRIERRFTAIPASECGFAYRDSRFKSIEPDRFVVTQVRFALAPGRAPEPRYPELQRALAELGRAPALDDVRRAVLVLRGKKSMLLAAGDENARSCGSFFMNPIVSADDAARVEATFGDPSMPRYPQPDGSVKLSAAWLIERSGFQKGLRAGKVGISSRHALALVCHEGASAADLVLFSRAIRAEVRARSGIELRPEPVIW